MLLMYTSRDNPSKIFSGVTQRISMPGLRAVCPELNERGETNHTSIYQCVLKIRVTGQELLVQKSCVGDVAVESDVEVVVRWEVFEVDRLEMRHLGLCWCL